MTQSDVKRLAFGAAVVGAIVAGTAVVLKGRKVKAVRAKKALKLESRLRKAGLHRVASRAQIAASRDEVLA